MEGSVAETGKLSMKPKALIIAFVAVIIFAADQLTKYLVVSRVGMGGSWTPFPNLPELVRITPGYNTGTACGYFPQFGQLFTFAPFLILAVVIYFYRSQPQPGWLLTLGTGLIIGGAFGNLVDRLRLGYVVDFIYVYRWPVFNIADAAVSTAVVLLLFWSLREDSSRPATGAEGEAMTAGTAARQGISWKLIVSFAVLLGVVALMATLVCVVLPAYIPR